VETVDFGLGDAQYKEILGKDSWQDISFYVFGITLRSCTLIALRTPIMFLDRVGRRLLEWTNLFGAIKKLWRRKARNREGAGKELSPPESA